MTDGIGMLGKQIEELACEIRNRDLGEKEGGYYVFRNQDGGVSKVGIPGHRKSMVAEDIDAFVALYANSGCTTPVYVRPGFGSFVTRDDANGHETQCVLRCGFSLAWAKRQEKTDLSHDDVLKLLRFTWDSVLEPSEHRALLAALEKIEWGNSTTVNRARTSGNDSLGVAVQNTGNTGKNIPEYHDFTFTPIIGLNIKVKVRYHFDIDPVNKSFSFVPLPSSLEAAEHELAVAFRDLVADHFKESSVDVVVALGSLP